MLKHITIGISLSLFLTACGTDAGTPASQPITKAPPVSQPSKSETAAMQLPGEQTSVATKYKKYNNNGISFEYPGDWQEIDTTMLSSPDPASKILGAVIDSKNSTFQENINVIVQDFIGLAPSGKVLAEKTIKEFSTSGEISGLSNNKLISLEERTYEKYKAAVLTTSYEISQTGTKVTLVQYMIPVGQQAYYLSFTLLQENYAKLKDSAIKQAIDTFKITE